MNPIEFGRSWQTACKAMVLEILWETTEGQPTLYSTWLLRGAFGSVPNARRWFEREGYSMSKGRPTLVDLAGKPVRARVLQKRYLFPDSRMVRPIPVNTNI